MAGNISEYLRNGLSVPCDQVQQKRSLGLRGLALRSIQCWEVSVNGIVIDIGCETLERFLI